MIVLINVNTDPLAHPNDDEVQDVVEAEEIPESVHPDLQDLLHDVVEDEDGEDDLGGREEVVNVLGVLEQLDGGYLLVGDHAARGGELEGQSVHIYRNELNKLRLRETLGTQDLSQKPIPMQELI